MRGGASFLPNLTLSFPAPPWIVQKVYPPPKTCLTFRHVAVGARFGFIITALADPAQLYCFDNKNVSLGTLSKKRKIFIYRLKFTKTIALWFLKSDTLKAVCENMHCAARRIGRRERRSVYCRGGVGLRARRRTRRDWRCSAERGTFSRARGRELLQLRGEIDRVRAIFGARAPVRPARCGRVFFAWAASFFLSPTRAFSGGVKDCFVWARCGFDISRSISACQIEISFGFGLDQRVFVYIEGRMYWNPRSKLLSGNYVNFTNDRRKIIFVHQFKLILHWEMYSMC